MAYLKNHSWHLFFIRNLFFYHLVLLRSCFPATLYMYVFLYVYSLPSWLSGKKKNLPVNSGDMGSIPGLGRYI